MNQLFSPSIDIDYLYLIADKDCDGYIGTTDALEFFHYTHLERQTLSTIWTLCVPYKQPMEKESFIKALRCCYYAQQHVELTTDLLNGKQSPYPSPSIDCPYILSSEKLHQLELSFNQLVIENNGNNGKISMEQLDSIIRKMNINCNAQEIMERSDRDKDNQLTFIEYIFSMICIHYYQLFTSLPETIPLFVIERIEQQLSERKQQPQQISRSKTRQLQSNSQIKLPMTLSRSQPLRSPRQSTHSSQIIQTNHLIVSPRSSKSVISCHQASVTKTVSPSQSSQSIQSLQNQSQTIKQHSFAYYSQSQSNIQNNQNIENKQNKINRLRHSSSSIEFSFNKTPRRNSTSERKSSNDFPFPIVSQSQSLSAKSSPSIEEMTMKRSDIIYSKSQSPFADDKSLSSYQRNRKELLSQIDNDPIDFQSFSFSDDSELSLDDIPMYNITEKWKIKKELDDMIMYLSMKRAELQAEISLLEHQDQ